MWRIKLIGITALAITSFANHADAKKPFTLEEGQRLRVFVERTNSDISRDGELVAMEMKSQANRVKAGPFNLTETGSAIEAGGELWICDTKQNKTFQLSGQTEFAYSPRWSPDSKRLAYYSDRDGKPKLWIWDRASQSARPASERIVRTTYGFELPEWSPDGRYVYFKCLGRDFERFYNKSNSNLQFAPFVPRKKRGEAPRKDSASVVRVRHTYPDKAPVHSDDQRPRGATIGSDKGIFDLVQYDTQTDEVVNIFTDIPMRDFDLSPDGNWVVATTVVGDEDAARHQLLHQCLVSSTGIDGNHQAIQARVLVPPYRESYGISTSWSPDSTRIAYLTSGPDSDGDLMVVDLKDGEIKNLTMDFPTKLTGEEVEQRPLWNPDGTYLYYPIQGDLWRFDADDGTPMNLTGKFGPAIVGVVAESQSTTSWTHKGSLLCQFRDEERSEDGFCKVVPATKTVREVRRDRQRYGYMPRFHVDLIPSSGEVVFRASDASSPGDIYLANKDFTSVRRLPSPNDWLEDYDLGQIEIVKWRYDSETKRGLLLIPTGLKNKRQPPCIVCVYPGYSPSGMRYSFRLSLMIGDASNANLRFFFERGFAVFMPDLPSTNGEPMRDIWQSLEPAVAALERTKLVDTKRLGLMGQSYGGYSVNSLITTTGRFRAAVSCSGMSNLVSSYLKSSGTHGSTAWYEDGQLGMRVSFPEDPDKYVRNSPVFRIDQATTPLLLVHGEQDSEYQQAVEMFGSLRRAGKVAQLATYPGAGHAFGSFTKDQIRDFWDRVLAWYEEHLLDDSTHN